MTKHLTIWLCTLALLAASGPAGSAPKATPPSAEAPIFYPPAPNEPRLQYLAKFSSAYDVSASSKGLRSFVFGGEKMEEQLIEKPYGLAIHDGAIYVVDTRGSGYAVFDLAAGKTRVVQGSGAGEMKKPINITIDTDGTRYVTDTEREAVLVFDRNDRFVRALGESGQFRPVDVAIAGDRLYVTDVKHQKVHVLDKRSGKTLLAFGEPGTGPGQMAHPTNLAIGPDGSVYLTDTTNFRIQQFTPEGEFVRQLGSAGTGFGQFARPKGIDVDKAGRIYVVDAAFQNVQIFDDDGAVLMFLGEPGQGRGNLYLPTVVKIDYDNVQYFRKYAAPGFKLEYLVLVASQFGLNKVVVFGFGTMQGDGSAARAQPAEPARDR